MRNLPRWLRFSASASDGDDQVARPSPEHAREADRQQDRGEGVEHVHGAHDQRVRVAADEAGGDPERAADQQRKEHRQHAQRQRNAATVQQARQHVPAEFVCSEPMALRADWRKPPERAPGAWIEGRDPRRQERRSEDREDEEREGHGERIAAKAP